VDSCVVEYGARAIFSLTSASRGFGDCGGIVTKRGKNLVQHLWPLRLLRHALHLTLQTLRRQRLAQNASSSSESRRYSRTFRSISSRGMVS
jgi:hypothetical protein